MMKPIPYHNFISWFLLTFILTACGAGSEDNRTEPASNTSSVELGSPKNIQLAEYDGTVFVSWASAKGATSYKLYVSKDPDIDFDNIDASRVTRYEVEGTSKALSDLEENETYFVVVASVSGDQEKKRQVTEPVVLKKPKLNPILLAPENLTVSADEGEVEINWDVLPEAYSYIIFFSDIDPQVDPSSAQQIQEISAPPFRHKELSINTSYYYRVSAITPLGLTPLTEVKSALVKPYSASPQVPGDFSASVGDGLVALKWRPAYSASSYNVYMAKEPITATDNVLQLFGGEIFFNITNVSTNRFDLENNTNYYFRVTAVNNQGESPLSKMLSATPKSFLPSVPYNISATNSGNGVKITWNKIEDAEGYYVYSSNSPNADKQTAFKSDIMTENAFFDSNLNSNNTIYYFVTAKNSNGESDASAVVSVPIIAPPAPVELEINVTKDKTVISWISTSEEVEEYVIYLASEAGIKKANYFRLANGKRLRNIRKRTFEVNNLVPDTQYYIRVASRNRGVEGRLSREAQFKTPPVLDITQTPPVILLNGDPQVSLFQGQNYVEQGAIASDKEEGDLSDKILITSNVDTLIPGTYQVKYNVTDSSKLAAEEVVRQVTVIKNQPPVILLNGDPQVSLFQGQNYVEQGATASDKEEGDLSDKILITSNVNTLIPGIYQVKYNVTDSSKLAAEEVVRQVMVIKNQPPVILLNGDPQVSLLQGQNYIEQGATASDKEEGDLSDKILITSNVNTLIPGTYQVKYNVTDSSKLAAEEVVRQVTVIENPPVISLNYPMFLNTINLPGGELQVYFRIAEEPRQQMTATNNGLKLELTSLSPGEYNITIEIEFLSDDYGPIILATASQTIKIVAGSNEFNLANTDFEFQDDNLDGELNIEALQAGLDPQGCVLDASLFDNCFWN
ncbi:MAG TPA: DUF5011 domain-containing protein [Gammaproteobacteria bacterium]|nr:DUF5011 domain-containing protein [Gammaproteobacteria bacterium]